MIHVHTASKAHRTGDPTMAQTQRFVVQYSIDVEPDEGETMTPLQAARYAYDCMSAPDAMLPILEVTDQDGQTHLIDLHEEGI
jgi:hypothetical protein